MPIPPLDARGYLPTGVHDCDIPEIRAVFGINPHRVAQIDQLELYLGWLRPMGHFSALYVDGSFISDKIVPQDIDVVVEIPIATPLAAIDFRTIDQVYVDTTFGLHVWPHVTGFPGNDFCEFFQYVGIKDAVGKGLPPKDRKGILRIIL